MATKEVIALKSPIRMSKAGACRLQHAHDIINESSVLRGFSIPMEMGTHLEPMIVKLLEFRGFETKYAKKKTDDPQLEVTIDNPYMQGHPDGIILLRQDPTEWMYANIPATALEKFTGGGVMLLEIKTMNSNTFKTFRSEGIMGDTFTATYMDQIQSYMGSIREGTITFDGEEIHTLNPLSCLVAVFCPSNRQIAFEYIEFDYDIYTATKLKLREGLEQVLGRGKMPEPDYDGTSPFCYFCSHSHVCPAMQQLSELAEVENFDFSDEDKIRIDELSIRYATLRTEKNDLDTRMSDVRDELDLLIPYNEPVKTDHASIHWVKGRESLDADMIAKLLGLEKRDLPKKRGNSSYRVKVKD